MVVTGQGGVCDGSDLARAGLSAGTSQIIKPCLPARTGGSVKPRCNRCFLARSVMSESHGACTMDPTHIIKIQ